MTLLLAVSFMSPISADKYFVYLLKNETFLIILIHEPNFPADEYFVNRLKNGPMNDTFLRIVIHEPNFQLINFLFII